MQSQDSKKVKTKQKPASENVGKQRQQDHTTRYPESHQQQRQPGQPGYSKEPGRESVTTQPRDTDQKYVKH